MATEHPNFNLLHDPNNPYTAFPILNQDVHDMYKKQEACFWTVEEVDLSKDRSDWEEKLNDDDRRFVKGILAFFSAGDGLVSENIDDNFVDDVDVKEVKKCYRFQSMMEDIHNEMYSVMIDTFITDLAEKKKTLDAMNTMPSIQKIIKWVLKWMNKENEYACRVIVFLIFEGLLFSGPFAGIFWLKKRNLMPGLTFSNELISRDEGMHTEFGIMMYNKLKKKLSEEKVHQIFKEAVEIEKEFINESIPCALIGMNSGLMSQYIEYVADRLLVLINYSKIYNSQNPFDFMEDIGIEGKTNFFEERVSQYSMSGVGTSEEDRTFDLDADF